MNKIYFLCGLAAFLTFVVGLPLKAEITPVEEASPTFIVAVSGQVIDAETEEPLPGATVMIKGSGTGTVTDVNGEFKLEVPADSAVLVVSFIGYHSQEIEVNGRTEIKVALAPDVEQLEEVVVVGYGVQKRSNITGAVSSISAEELEKKTLTRLDQALQGESAGVFVSQNGGAPGASPTIHIRGVGSISDTEPLWIVDGIRMAPGNHFDIDDVASIEVLKDAAASAIYGAKAAHGVILVTTKRGAGDGTRVSFKSTVGKKSPLNLPTLLGSADFVKYKKESRLNAGQNPDPSWDNWEHDTDWIDAYYAGSGILQSYDLSVARGEEKFNFYFSLGYDDEVGILIDNTYKRISGRINSDIQLTDWLKIGESILLSKVGENPIDNFNENTSGGIPYRSIPIMPIYDETNPYGGWGRAPVYFQGPNPVASHYQQHDTRSYNRLDGNVYVEATPFDGLQLRATLGYNYLAFLGEKFHEAFDYGAFANPINSLTYSNAHDQTITGNAVATYSESIGLHNFSLMGGYEASRFESKHFNLTGTDFPLDVAWSMNLATGTFNTTDRHNVYESRILSQFGRLSYNYNEKYLLEANVRRDASAPKFGPANIWGVFPSFSAGWRISGEEFFRNVPYITTLKLRASTGILGSDNIGDYIYLKTYTSQFSSYTFDVNGQNKVPGFYISKFPNEEVKWEEVNMHNIAMDLTAFENKLSFSIDYYIKDTKDLLYGVPIPPSVGLSTMNFGPVNPALNIGTMRNTGVDIALGYRTHFDKLTLNLSGNTSFMKNEMKFLSENQAITGGGAGGLMGGMTRTEAGMPISSFYGFVVQQMLHTESDVYAINSWASDGTYQEAGTGPGDFMYKDISGPEGVPDGQITAEHDRVFIGNPWPKMTYALNVGAVYNNIIDISLQFQGVQGVDVFNANKAYAQNFFGDNNTTTEIYNAWTPENHTNQPRNIANDPNGNFSRPSDYFVEDGSYLKLRNAQLGFNLPDEMLDRWGMSGLRIFVNANNVLTFTKYSGLDPEVAGSNISRGVDYGLYPQVRTISGGLEVNF
ncbi:SusC/RagA family TonB-linked outer membrane protein [Nafulsella turpanensis]|uniref:SusC/RagA family TonB-linked outer membrane protein n=1 Tax=Nafulsella turpanensis TaxID=1265690 RepID=UPI00034A9382|nr:TonB-dependent receptor [Nafulsella turpanensis]